MSLNLNLNLFVIAQGNGSGTMLPLVASTSIDVDTDANVAQVSLPPPVPDDAAPTLSLQEQYNQINNRDDWDTIVKKAELKKAQIGLFSLCS